MKHFTITLKPTITMEIDLEIEAETKNQAITKGEAYIVRQIALALGADPADTKIKFE
jgi:hypothetical protein